MLFRIHHVEIHTKRVSRLLDQLCSRLDFRPAFAHPRGVDRGALVTKGRVRFLLRPLLPSPTAPEDDPGPDRIVDMAFETPRLDLFAKHAVAVGAVASTATPSLRFLSPAGSGLWHTVLQQHQDDNSLAVAGCAAPAAACCFPDLVPVESPPSICDDRSGAFIDHVALACRASESASILAWYEKLFQLSRYRVNSTETELGFVVRYKESGMNLKAIRSTELPEVPDESFGLKFVFAESLNSAPNQINTFLREHGCTGVQHMAIHLDNFVDNVAMYRKRGMQFMDPPGAYYSNQINAMQRAMGLDLQAVQDNHILVDCEADEMGRESQSSDSGDRYLMQVFTKPLLSEETFFLELISRVGARGFGAGNISALWRAVEAHMSSTGRL